MILLMICEIHKKVSLSRRVVIYERLVLSWTISTVDRGMTMIVQFFLVLNQIYEIIVFYRSSRMR